VVAGVAAVAGAPTAALVLAAASMTFLQFAIGAVNDVVDAPRDAGRKPHKPIPSGGVTASWAVVVGIGAATLGLGMALAVGVVLAAVAVVVLGIGLVYDLRLKGTPWSWLPFAVGIPILPVYGWLGARGTVPDLTPVILGVAFLEGAALALANGLVDIERDRDAGTESAVTRLGAARAAALGIAIQVTVALAAGGAGWGIGIGVPAAWVAGTASVLMISGSLVSRSGVAVSTTPGIERRELGWRIQALGAAVLALGWIGGAAQAGRL
jgi:4-hydroxybenzoate polyprenyltransferase